MNNAAGQDTNTSITPGRGKHFLWFGVFILLVLIAGVFAFAFRNVQQVRESMEEDLRQRQQTVVASRIETTDAWLESLVEQSRRLVGSDLFQIFATEVDKLPGVPLLLNPTEGEGNTGTSSDKEQAAQLSSQLPLMRTILAEFVSYTGFSEARILNSRAQTYMTTEHSASSLSSSQRQLAAQVVETGRLIYAPLEFRPKGLTLDIYIPILPPSYQQDGHPAGVLILSQAVDGKLAEILSSGILAEEGRSLKLVQKNGDIFVNVLPGTNTMRQVSDFPVNDKGSLPFALRVSYGGTGEVYSSGLASRVTDWWVVVENDASILQTSLRESARATYTVAGLVALALILLISTAWWRLVGREQSAINARITNLLTVIDDQKKLLDGINSTISDPISLTDNKGVYQYVNEAFAAAVGRTAGEVIGLDGPAVFGFDTAKRLNTSDQHVLMTGESISVMEVLWLQSKRYDFQISKTPLREEGVRSPKGIVSVFRDITELVQTQERSRRVVQQTINALVRSIEEVDPFLGGHSRVMGGIAALIAKQLRLSDRDVATVETSANLSQIGKMFVPRDVLLKPGALTPEEKQEMERHVEHARSVLSEIEFDLPVVDAISQMNERLDGRGYPNGLSGDEISMDARVLAVANAFTAMAKPRSYRAALPVEEIMDLLEKQKESYDAEVVAALRQVIATPAGERLVQQAASAKAV